jgi:hypothetical protein
MVQQIEAKTSLLQQLIKKHWISSRQIRTNFAHCVKAFDTIQHMMLLWKLKRYGIYAVD